MSTTPSVGPRPAWLAPVLAFIAVATGALSPVTGGAATAQAAPVNTSTAALDRLARLDVDGVSLADALSELELARENPSDGVDVDYAERLAERKAAAEAARNEETPA